ncbi:MAG: hypothetical protein ACYCTB_10945 [bacterium]
MGFNNHIIKTWCGNQHMSITEFAEKVGITKTHMFNIVWEKKSPSKKLALKIEKITNGEIKVSDLKK